MKYNKIMAKYNKMHDTALKLFTFDNSYARLPEKFYRRWMPTPVKKPALVAFNRALALELGMLVNNIKELELATVFAGNRIPEGAEPLAMAYAGHQFGHFVPQLGDGRALLLGEIIDTAGIRRDIQLKGAGQTPFSRNGDGRAALGPVIREYLVSEAMHTLGILTTRSLAAVTTGEPVYRGEVVLPGAIITRVAKSHIRIGTFEYFQAQGDETAIQYLADYAIDRLYPEAKAAANPYIALLASVIEAQARLVSSWMQIGFIHGVMNTDNMAISGETIDYGPCAFMDYYDPMMVFSSIDQYGRYAFGNQPLIAQWNLTRFAETLLTLLDPNVNKAIVIAKELLENFIPRFQLYWLNGMRKKLGLMTEEAEDLTLIKALLDLMQRNQTDYTLTFRLLCNAADTGNPEEVLQLFAERQVLMNWLRHWQERLARQPQSIPTPAQVMRQTNPAYIPRNHRIEQVIAAATERADFSPMTRLHQVLLTPYEEQANCAEYALPPLPTERVQQTFCGT